MRRDKARVFTMQLKERNPPQGRGEMRVDKASLQILSRGTNQNGLGYVQNRICQRLPPLGFSSNDKKAEVVDVRRGIIQLTGMRLVHFFHVYILLVNVLDHSAIIFQSLIWAPFLRLIDCHYFIRRTAILLVP